MPGTLQYKPFAACAQLAAAVRKNPVLRVGRYGPGVRLIQGALLDLGYALPRSIRKGGPDGIFGHETEALVRRYQQDAKLDADGVLGPGTVLSLDRAMCARSRRVTISRPSVPKLPMTLEYMVGRDIPPIQQDAGAGPWRSKNAEYCYRALKDTIVSALPHASGTFGPDAARHLTHFFNNTGNPIHINLWAMLSEVPSARSAYTRELMQAQDFVEALPSGRYDITSRCTQDSYNAPEENRNWYLANGGYKRWGTGAVEIIENAGRRSYVLDFEYHVFDRYNWDGGKSVNLYVVEITDEFMGEFHRQGLAREFDCWGKYRQRYTWKHGEPFTNSIMSLSPSAPDARVS